MIKRSTIFILCLLLFGVAIVNVACAVPQKTNPDNTTGNPISTSANNQTTIDGLAVKLSLDKIIENSDALVMGKVAKILPARLIYVAQFNRELPCTDVIFETNRFLLGSAQSPNIAVQVWGGQIGGQTVSISDSPAFKLGEEVALFLEKVPEGSQPPEGIAAENYFIVYGSAQGKYAVNNGTLVDWEGNQIALPDVEQKIQSMRGS
jgi:hypothetical protein